MPTGTELLVILLRYLRYYRPMVHRDPVSAESSIEEEDVSLDVAEDRDVEILEGALDPVENLGLKEMVNRTLLVFKESFLASTDPVMGLYVDTGAAANLSGDRPLQKSDSHLAARNP